MPWRSLTPSSRPPDAWVEGAPVSVPDHVLLRRIGRGSYGEVWLARNALGQYRAVKVLHRASFGEDRPFEREFLGIQRFEPVSRSHESQLNILHVGRCADHFYYVMELADDQGGVGVVDEASYSPRTLRSELLFRGRLPVEECVRLGLALTTALGHLHRHGLVHRDIKPSNIVFVNGIPKLADIGLVALAERTMSFVGTEGYLPPEGPGTVQADLFSLGKVLYEISTGHDRQQFPELPTGVGKLPDRGALSELNEVLVRACAPEVKHRYQTAAELHADLALLQSGGSVARQRRLAGRLRFLQRAGVLVTVLAVVIAAGWAWQARQTGQLREMARRASDSEMSARQRLYAADVTLVHQALEAGNLRLARSLLGEHVPAPGETDMRGFEWRLLWQMARSEELFSLSVHTNESRVIALAPDGRLLAVGGHFDGNIRLVDLMGRREIGMLADTNRMLSLSFDPKGGLLASGSRNGISLWDTGSLKEVRRLTNAAAPAVFSPDGRFLVTARGPWSLEEAPWKNPQEVLVWDTVTWTVTNSATFVPSGVFSVSRDLYLQVAFGSDSSRFAMLNGGTVRWVGCPDLTEVLELSERLPEIAYGRPFVALSPDNRTLAIPSPKSFGVRLWDLVENVELRILSGHSDHVFSAAFSPDGTRLATASPDQAVKLWQVSDGELVHTFRGHADEVGCVEYSSDGTKLVSLGITQSTVIVWDPETRRRPETLPGWLGPQGFDPGGRFVAISGAGEAVLVDPSDLSMEPFPYPVYRPGRGYLMRMNGLSSDGRYQGLVSAEFSELEVWDRRSGERVASLPLSAPDFSFDPVRNWVTTEVTNASGVLILTGWQLPEGTRKWELPEERGGLVSTTQGDYLVSKNAAQVYVRSLEQDALGPGFLLSREIRGRIALSPDGKWLAASVDDINLHSMPSGEPVGVLRGHTRRGVQTAFSPDSRTVASIADDHTARLWHLASRREMLRFDAPLMDYDLFQIEFSPDGRALAIYRHDAEKPAISLFFAPSFAEIAAAEGDDFARLAGEDAPTWYAVSRELLRGGKVEAAWSACVRATELAEARDEVGWWLGPSLRNHRIELLGRMGRVDEQVRERLILMGIPLRDPATPDGAIDLSEDYRVDLAYETHLSRANDLREVPTGWQRFGGTDFDVRAMVVVRAGNPGEEVPDEMRRAEGIRIGRRLDRLHFLHKASGDSTEIRTGDRVGHYLIHYADGHSVEVPIRYNVEVSDYWELEHLPKELPGADVVWRGQNPESRERGLFIRLFRFTWENPHPEMEVTHLDFVAERFWTFPWLVALTAE
jgi:WD40 repeat protein